MTLKRNDKQYLDVESFEEYEFTKCIAYEMAIRNDRVVEIVKNELTNPGMANMEEEKELIYEYAIESGYHDYHFFKEEIKIYNKYFKEFIDHKEDIPKQTKEDIWKSEGYKSSKFIIQDGFYHRSVVAMDGITPYYESNVISPYFKRPRMYSELSDNEVAVYIDLALPENELIAYIKHLKKLYNRNIFTTPYDEFIHKIAKTDKHKKSLPKGSKMADIFFVYDCLKLGYKKSKIRNEIYNSVIPGKKNSIVYIKDSVKKKQI